MNRQSKPEKNPSHSRSWAKAKGVLPVAGLAASSMLLTGCFDFGHQRGEQAPNPNPSATALAPTGQAMKVEPGVEVDKKGAIVERGVGWQTAFITPPADSIKQVEHFGQDVCPTSPDKVNSAPQWTTVVPVKNHGSTINMTAGMLDTRCADFPGQPNGAPVDGDITARHLIGFEKATTESKAVDLGAPTRSLYLSEYMGMCTVSGALFEGTDGTYSNTWLAVYAANADMHSKPTMYVPYAEAAYVQGSGEFPLAACSPDAEPKS